MYSIALPLSCDTSVYSQYPDNNFSKCHDLDPLNKLNNGSKILFKLPKILLDIISGYEIIDATLNCHGYASSIIISNIAIYENKTNYCCSNVTWNTCPAPNSLASYNPWIYNPCDNLLSCNILNLVNKITSLNSLSKGYQMIVECKKTSLSFYSSHSTIPPFLHLTVKPINLCHSFIQSYLYNPPPSPSISIPVNSNVPFNSIDLNNFIDLNNLTNEIRICKAGNYIVDWWVDYSGGIGINTVTLSLEDSNKVIYASSCPANSPGIATGHATLIVSHEDAKNNYAVKLCNNSYSFSSSPEGGTLYLSPIPMPASIRITKV